jgi:hypothetical protein
MLAYSIAYALYKPKFDYLEIKIDSLENLQDILHQGLIKLKNIMDTDNDLSNDQTNQLKEIKKEIQVINKILNIKQSIKDDESNSDSNDQESDDTILSPKNKPALPVQNHIIFPQFFILNDKNFKQKKISDHTYELRFIGDDLRVISNQLAKFIKVNIGTCMEFEEAYNCVYNYIQDNDIIDISEDTQLCRLFGITGNEDYEYSDSMIIKILKKILEPHFKKITYECITSK